MDTGNKLSYNVSVEIIVIKVPTCIQEVIEIAILQFKSYKYKCKNRFRYPLNTQACPILPISRLTGAQTTIPISTTGAILKRIFWAANHSTTTTKAIYTEASEDDRAAPGGMGCILPKKTLLEPKRLRESSVS